MEGAATKERLKEFNPLFTLRYSATHKKDSVYKAISTDSAVYDVVDSYAALLDKVMSYTSVEPM